MSNDRQLPPPKISEGSPESFGWQRRPDLDTASGLAYEKPTGDLMLFPRAGPKPVIAKINMSAWLRGDSSET